MQVGSVFSNFEEFAKSFDKFQKETHQLFVRFKSSTIEFKNSTSNNGKYNTDLKWYYVYYMCKHGGKPRHSGNGVSRPSQKSIKLHCPAFVKVNADRETQQLVVRQCSFEHNHKISEELFKHYPENRRLSHEEFLSVVSIVDSKTKPSELRKKLKPLIKKPLTRQDVNNILVRVSKYKSKAQTLENGNESSFENGVGSLKTDHDYLSTNTISHEKHLPTISPIHSFNSSNIPLHTNSNINISSSNTNLHIKNILNNNNHKNPLFINNTNVITKKEHFPIIITTNNNHPSITTTNTNNNHSPTTRNNYSFTTNNNHSSTITTPTTNTNHIPNTKTCNNNHPPTTSNNNLSPTTNNNNHPSTTTSNNNLSPTTNNNHPSTTTSNNNHPPTTNNNNYPSTSNNNNDNTHRPDFEKMNTIDRQNFAKLLLRQMVECIADCGSREFEKRMNVLECLTKMWTQSSSAEYDDDDEEDDEDLNAIIKQYQNSEDTQHTTTPNTNFSSISTTTSQTPPLVCVNNTLPNALKIIPVKRKANFNLI